MSTAPIILTHEQLDFISYMKSLRNLTPAQTQKLEQLIVRPNSFTRSQNSSSNFDELRAKHMPEKTADFLYLFGVPSGLKFLTHDFDPESPITMDALILHVEQICNNHKGTHKSIFALLQSFINGKEWTDSYGAKHSFYLKLPKFQKWAISHPGVHPISSVEFGREIQDFRNTVRLSKPNLPNLINSIVAKNNLATLAISMSNLDKADFYTNVFWLRRIIEQVLKDISQRNSRACVSISYDRSASQQYRLCNICITHEGSEANEFNDVRSKLTSEGGAMFSLLKYCSNFCDWTIEAKFEDGCRRWRVLDRTNSPELEDLDSSSVNGFRHIFKFYKRLS
jgi:hypothetical protein